MRIHTLMRHGDRLRSGLMLRAAWGQVALRHAQLIGEDGRCYSSTD